jgi:hypothetical protein
MLLTRLRNARKELVLMLLIVFMLGPSLTMTSTSMSGRKK